MKTLKTNINIEGRRFFIKSNNIKDVINNLNVWADHFKIGAYEGLNVVAQRLEETLKSTHSANAWFNEPVGRTPGDLETTYVGFVQPAIGDRKWNQQQAFSEEGAMRNWGAKPMTEETQILSRSGTPKGKLGQYEMERSHTTEEVYKYAAIPFIARAIITSPMSYAYFTEMGDPDTGGAGYPVLNAVIDTVGAEMISIIGEAIRLRLKTYSLFVDMRRNE